MIKRLLMILVIVIGCAKAQATLTNYPNIQWDKGTSTPSYCTEPGLYYRTDIGMILPCVNHSFSAPFPNPTMLNAPVKFNMNWATAANIMPQGLTHLTMPANPYVTNDYNYVEPHLYYNPAGWNGYKYWLYACPYDNSNAAHENGSLFVSNDGVTFITAPGITNPIVPNPVFPGAGNNSDGGIADGYDGYMYVYWQTLSGDGNTRYTYAMRSSDGKIWSAPTRILTVNTATNNETSPWIFYDGTTWHMYSVDDTSASAGFIVHHTASSIFGPWSVSSTVITSGNAPSGKTWFHLDGLYVGGRVYLLIAAPDSGSTATNSDLYLAWADDFSTFTVANNVNAPFIKGNRVSGDAYYSMYKSSIVLVSDGYQFKFGCLCGGVGTPWTLSYQEFGNSQAITALTNTAIADASIRFALACSSISPGVMCDNFHRANSASAVGTSSAGNYAWTTDVGTAGISGNLFYLPSAANTKVEFDSGIGNGRIVMLYNTMDPAAQSWIMFRYTDSNNYYRYGYLSGSGLVLQKVVSGVVTLLGSATNVTPGNTDWIQITFNGNSFGLYWNNNLLQTVTDSTFGSSITKVGIQTADTTVRIAGFGVLTQ